MRVFAGRLAIALTAVGLTVAAVASTAPAERRVEACRVGGGDEARQPYWVRARRVTFLADSVLLSAKPALRSKRCWRVSIRGRPALMLDVAARTLRARGRRVAPLAVVGLGYNSLWERGGRQFGYWAARFDRQARALLRTLRRLGARQIVWVTLRQPTAGLVPPAGLGQVRRYSYYFPWVNQRLRGLARRRRDLVLADWRKASDRRGLTYDAIQVNTRGAGVMDRTIWRAVRREARRRRPSAAAPSACVHGARDSRSLASQR